MSEQMLQHDQNLRKMEEVRRRYVEEKEKGFKSFTYLGKALDSSLGLLFS